jgi:hypothetical protein
MSETSKMNGVPQFYVTALETAGLVSVTVIDGVLESRFTLTHEDAASLASELNMAANEIRFA